jgi:hypothetical protein
VDNQLSSRRFRGLASDCFCHHRTPYTSYTWKQLAGYLHECVTDTYLMGSLSGTLSSSRISNTSPPLTYFTPVRKESIRSECVSYRWSVTNYR